MARITRSEKAIVARICKVRRTHEKTKRKSKFADYKYLRSVLRAHNYFEENDLLEHLAEIAPSVLMTPVRSGQHPLRTIIDASCDRGGKTSSRWTRALEFAVLKNIPPDDLLRFLRANNGISGCADLASKTAPSRRRHQSHVVGSTPGLSLPARAHQGQ